MTLGSRFRKRTGCCLILNVEDNIVNFEGKLAFSDLDWLWA